MCKIFKKILPHYHNFYPTFLFFATMNNKYVFIAIDICRFMFYLQTKKQNQINYGAQTHF